MNIPDINPTQILQQRIASAMGLDKYRYIMKTVREIDVRENEDFQHMFNGFYRVRRNEDWRKIYYQVFEEAKMTTPAFGDVLHRLYDATGNVEASFSSKMIATLNPQMPIWDRYVIQSLGIEVPKYGEEKRLDIIIMMYDQIVAWYKDFLQSEKARECIMMFDGLLTDYQWISDVKKIDFFIWSIR